MAVTDPLRFFPENAPSREAAELLTRTFPEGRAASQAVVVIESTAPIGESGAAREAIAALASRLRSELAAPPGAPTRVSGVLAPTDDPVLERRLFAKDGLAALVVVRLEAGFASEEASAVVAKVERLAEAALAGVPGLSFAISGDATLGRDYLRAIEEGALRSAVATVLLVALALLVVYRAPLAALASLATLAVALGVASGAVVLAAKLGLPVAFQSRGFLVALVWGVGTDYCLLFFARVREESRPAGTARALQAAHRATAPVLLTSAAAVVLACALMGFASFGLFAFSGPSLAIGVAVMLAAVLTLTPTLMSLAGPLLFWPARFPAPGDAPSAAPLVWQKIARLVVARPASVLRSASRQSRRSRGSARGSRPLSSSRSTSRSRALRSTGWTRCSGTSIPRGHSARPGRRAARGARPICAGRTRSTVSTSSPCSSRGSPGSPGCGARRSRPASPGCSRGRRCGRSWRRCATASARQPAGRTRLVEGLDDARREVGHGRADLSAQKAALAQERDHSLLGAFAPGRFSDASHELDTFDARLARLEGGLGDGVRGARALAAGVEQGRARLEATRPGAGRRLVCSIASRSHRKTSEARRSCRAPSLTTSRPTAGPRSSRSC